MAVNPGNVAPSSNLFPSGCYTNAIQEQIAASHEFDGVRKEKERLTAASLKIEWENDAAPVTSLSLSLGSHLVSTVEQYRFKVWLNRKDVRSKEESETR